MAQGGGNSGDPSGLGQPGFGWGTDPKTGAYRYGKMGAGGFLEPGTGEIPPTDPAAPRTTGNIPVTKGSGGGGLGTGIAGAVVVFFLIVGGVVALTVMRVSHTVTTMFPGGNCVGGPLIGGGGADIGDGRVRFPCAGGGTMIVNFNSGPPVVSPTPKPSHHHHHHHQNANG